MKLTILGNHGPYPCDGGGCSSYLLNTGDKKIILDAGTGCLSALSNILYITDIDAFYISHLHFDHTSDLLPLRYMLESRNKKMRIFVHLDDSDYCKFLFNHPLFDVVNIDEDSEIQFGDWMMTFRKMKHPAEDYAVKFSRNGFEFVYTGDTVYTPELEEFCKNARAILADAAKAPGFNGPHMTTDDAVRLQKLNNGLVFITHLSETDSEFNTGLITTVSENMKYIF